MSPALDPALATRYVVWGALLLGLVLGVVGQATRFCVRGAIADWVIFRGPGRLVSWLVAVAIAAVLVQAMVSAQVFDASRTIFWGNRLLWLSALVGGVLFGYGMILSGGCPQRSLVKAGSGNLRSLVTLLVIAIAAAMTLRGAFAGVRVNWLDAWGIGLAGSQDLGALAASATGLSAGALRWLFTLVLGGAVLGFAWSVRGSVDRAHWVGGVVVGLLVAACFYLTGRIGFLAEHPETLEPAWLGTQSKRPEALSFSAPLAHGLDLLTLWSDKATVATFGVMLSLGVLFGAFVSAKLRGDFRLESFGSPREVLEHLAGGVLMGFGGVTALGCSIGNGVTGVALLSAGSFLAIIGITAGALLALRVQMRKANAAPVAGAVPQPANS